MYATIFFLICIFPWGKTPYFNGNKKQSEEQVALFDVLVHLLVIRRSCCSKLLFCINPQLIAGENRFFSYVWIRIISLFDYLRKGVLGFNER